jgi:hypothetical protein
MKFERAYCEEVNRVVTPYIARELYFNEDSQFYSKKLSFLCEDKECRKVLVPVGIYLQRRTKRALHFRSKDALEHKCDKNNIIGGHSGSEIGNDDPFKITRYPTELILDPPKPGGSKIGGIDIDDEDDKSNKTSNSTGPGTGIKETRYRIRSFEHLIDCYINGDKKVLETMKFTINGKTKKFYSFFKKVKYYSDEEGLVYYGEVSGIKKYGEDYKIYFEDKAWVENSYKTISIYIDNGLINKFGKRKTFREQLNDLCDIGDKRVTCYFVGIYPEVTEYEVNNEKKKSVQVKIKDLRHFVLTYDEI